MNVRLLKIGIAADACVLLIAVCVGFYRVGEHRGVAIGRGDYAGVAVAQINTTAIEATEDVPESDECAAARLKQIWADDRSHEDVLLALASGAR